jgi:hypothetical protein
VYFLANLRRTPSTFFIHWFFIVVNLLTMPIVFRMIRSLSRTLVQAIPPVAVLSLLCSIYNGFIVPPRLHETLVSLVLENKPGCLHV